MILPAIRFLKENRDCTIMVHFSVNQFGYSNTGLSAKRLLSEAETCGYVDRTGLNCGVGPGHMEQLVKKFVYSKNMFLSVFPNSGYPKYRNHHLTFTDNADYFTEKMKENSRNGRADFWRLLWYNTEIHKKCLRQRFRLTGKKRKRRSRLQKTCRRDRFRMGLSKTERKIRNIN